ASASIKGSLGVPRCLRACGLVSHGGPPVDCRSSCRVSWSPVLPACCSSREPAWSATAPVLRFGHRLARVTSRLRLEVLFTAVAYRELTPAAAADELASMPFIDLSYARVDTHRELRQEASEAILGQGKTPEQVAGIALALADAGASSVLVTRADDEMRRAVTEALPDAIEHELARAVWVERTPLEKRGNVLIISAGTSDGPIVHETRIRAELLGTEVTVQEDGGVAGPPRLAAVLPDLRHAGVVAGDMLLAALLDAGAPHDVLHDSVRGLGLGDVKVEVSRTERHGIAATHVDVIEEAGPAERRAEALIDAVARADLAPRVAATALDALDRLIRAESTIHGVSRDDLVVHDVGGSDTLIDIVGAFALFDALGVERVACAPLPYARV